MDIFLNLVRVFCRVFGENCVSEAEKIFEGSGVNVVCSHRMLGGVIGSMSGKRLFVENQIKKWVSQLECLTKIALSQPQAAFAAFTKSLQFRWSYVQRVTSNCQLWFADLEEVIGTKFIPNLMMSDVSEHERMLLSLPARWGGLGVCNPTNTGDMSYLLSRRATGLIVESIKSGCDFEPRSHHQNLVEVKAEGISQKEQIYSTNFDSVIEKFDTLQQRAIMRARTAKISTWLTVLPLAKSHFDLSAQEFRDGLAIRYKKPLLNAAELCDGCGAVFNLSHALSCRKGGLVVQRHNEVRDTVGDLASLVWSKVRREPIIRESNYSTDSTALVADLGVRGVWSPQSETLFDVRVVDTDAPSYCDRTPTAVLKSAEREEKTKYSEACEERHSLFTPLCCSVDGMVGGEANVFLKLVGERLAGKWDQSYGEVMGWIRA